VSRHPKKERPLTRAVVIALLLSLAPAAHGAIFGWTDTEGTEHYTNRESEIPLPYRDKARIVVREPADSQTPEQAGQTKAFPPSATRFEEPTTGSARSVGSPEEQNASKVPGVRKSVGRHRNPHTATE
jgi:Domain of unknown function (DUF4124)